MVNANDDLYSFMDELGGKKGGAPPGASGGVPDEGGQAPWASGGGGEDRGGRREGPPSGTDPECNLYVGGRSIVFEYKVFLFAGLT